MIKTSAPKWVGASEEALQKILLDASKASNQTAKNTEHLEDMLWKIRLNYQGKKDTNEWKDFSDRFIKKHPESDVTDKAAYTFKRLFGSFFGKNKQIPISIDREASLKRLSHQPIAEMKKTINSHGFISVNSPEEKKIGRNWAIYKDANKYTVKDIVALKERFPGTLDIPRSFHDHGVIKKSLINSLAKIHPEAKRLEDLSKVPIIQMLNNHSMEDPAPILELYRRLPKTTEAVNTLDAIYSAGAPTWEQAKRVDGSPNQILREMQRIFANRKATAGRLKFTQEHPNFLSKIDEASVPLSKYTKEIKGTDLCSISGSPEFGSVCISNKGFGTNHTGHDYVESALNGKAKILTYTPENPEENVLMYLDKNNKILEMSGKNNSPVKRTDNFLKELKDLGINE